MTKRKRSSQRFAQIMGIGLAIAMGASLLLPLFSMNTPTNNTQPPTTAPEPTVPTPPDTATITFDETYLHPSALFTVAVPSGWSPENDFSTTGEAQVTMRNPDILSVVEVRVLRPVQGVELTTEGISDFFSNDWLASSWREYTSWRETERRTEDDQLIIDFNLSRASQDYIARQISYTDGTWIYSARTVTPSNAPQVLRHVLDNVIDSFQPVERYIGAPMEWQSYFDSETNVVLRYPGTWTVADSAPGAPTSITGDAAQLRFETLDETLGSEDAAQEYVAGLRSNLDVQSVETVEQGDLSGYTVSYTLTTLDGATQSGIVQILNGDATYVMNLLLADAEVEDLNTVDAEANPQLANTLSLLDSFAILPELASAAN